MARYKKSIIEKVLFHDLQSANNNVNKPAGKPCNDKDGKKLTTLSIDIYIE